jgi:predicted secreted protein
MRQLDETANGSAITLHKGESVEIRLRENRTTGFKWHLRGKGEPVCEVESEDFQPEETGVGVGGTHSWKIKALAKGTARIELSLARSWEVGKPSAQAFALTIHAED